MNDISKNGKGVTSNTQSIYKTDDEQETQKITTEENIKPQPVFKKTDGDFPYEVHDSLNGNILVKFTNNTSATQTIELEAVYYKGENMIYAKEEQAIRIVGAKQTSCSTLKKPVDEEENPIAYDRIEIDIAGKANDYYKNRLDKVSIEHNMGAKDIIIKVTNNGEDEINLISFSVLLYKDGVIKAVPDIFETDLQAGSSRAMAVEIPFGSDVKPIEFDRYEVVITTAYISEYTKAVASFYTNK